MKKIERGGGNEISEDASMRGAREVETKHDG